MRCVQEGEAAPAPAPVKARREKKLADDDDDGTWTVDVSEAAVRARMQGNRTLHSTTILISPLQRCKKKVTKDFEFYLHKSLI